MIHKIQHPQKINLFAILLLLNLLIIGCESESVYGDNAMSPSHQDSLKVPIKLVVHGGAGYIRRGSLSAEQEKVYQKTLETALSIGYDWMTKGGSSAEAVVKTLSVLEDSPLYNAGQGAVLTHEGKVSMDASIMDGSNLNAGAIAGSGHIKNPILAAKLVMDSSDHVLLSGEGADYFADMHGLELKENAYFIVPKQLQSLKRILGEDSILIQKDEKIIQKFGTVGCVAIDSQGTISAGTSTGGMMNKKYGRIGDSPIIGAGTYADNTTVGVSCTGQGEYFIRLSVAKTVSDLMEYKNLSLAEAAHEVIHHQLENLGGKGGLIAMDAQGNVIWEFNTPGMFRGVLGDDQPLVVKFYEKTSDYSFL